MRIIVKWSGTFVAAVLLAALVAPSPLQGGETKTEDQLIEDLKSPKAETVTDALQQLEKKYPTTTKAIPVMKGLITDSRQPVRRKAVRVLGILHAEVDQKDVQNICAFLKSEDSKEVVDGLKALRDLNSSACLPAIVACLDNPAKIVLRDACRTLAVVGNKDHIKSIEPLLGHSDPAVQKDAQDAIFKLKSKS